MTRFVIILNATPIDAVIPNSCIIPIGSKIKVPKPTKSVTRAIVPGTNNLENEALAAYSAVWPSITSLVI